MVFTTSPCILSFTKVITSSTTILEGCMWNMSHHAFTTLPSGMCTSTMCPTVLRSVSACWPVALLVAWLHLLPVLIVALILLLESLIALALPEALLPLVILVLVLIPLGVLLLWLYKLLLLIIVCTITPSTSTSSSASTSIRKVAKPLLLAATLLSEKREGLVDVVLASFVLEHL